MKSMNNEIDHLPEGLRLDAIKTLSSVPEEQHTLDMLLEIQRNEFEKETSQYSEIIYEEIQVIKGAIAERDDEKYNEMGEISVELTDCNCDLEVDTFVQSLSKL